MAQRIDIRISEDNGDDQGEDTGSPPARRHPILRVLLYGLGAICCILALLPLLHWWSIPAGLAAFALFLKLPLSNPSGTT